MLHFIVILPKHVLNNYAAIGDAGWFRPDMKLDKVGYTNEMETMVNLVMQVWILIVLIIIIRMRINQNVFLHP